MQPTLRPVRMREQLHTCLGLEIFLKHPWETGPYRCNPLAVPSIRQARRYGRERLLLVCQEMCSGRDATLAPTSTSKSGAYERPALPLNIE
ncbi:unnamed protein product [Tetraodon nigroviridis]|uniref:(spotted green pufferfish) hypothetical protein n=1 Tax=Tetraodon nigroviridis TaxID=99883 RepID=Q4SM25_TETNG|nr:unnamed protein product [Tetraodon nigroviridis]